MISRINKDSLGISVITPTSTLIILDITKTSPNNCLKSDQIVTHKNTQVFHMVNKLIKVCVLWVNDSWIHRVIKIAWDDIAVELGCCEWRGLLLKKSERISEQALSCSLRGGACNCWGLTALAQFHVLYSDRAYFCTLIERALSTNGSAR